MKANNTLISDLRSALSDFTDIEIHKKPETHFFPLPDLDSDATLRGVRVLDLFRLPETKELAAPIMLEAFEELVHGYVVTDHLAGIHVREHLKQKFKRAKFPTDLLCPTGALDEAIVMLLWFCQTINGGDLLLGPRTALYRRPDSDDVRGIDEGKIYSRFDTLGRTLDISTEIFKVFKHGVPIAARTLFNPAAVESHLMRRTGGPGLVLAWRLYTIFHGVGARSRCLYMPKSMSTALTKKEEDNYLPYRTKTAGRLVGLTTRLVRRIDEKGIASHLDLKTAYRLLVPAFCSSRDFQREVGNPKHAYKDMTLVTVRIKDAVRNYVTNKNPKLKGTP